MSAPQNLRKRLLQTIFLVLSASAIVACGGGGGGNTTSVTSGTAVTTSNTTPIQYEWFSLSSGSRVYNDRAYTYSVIPSAYDGLVALRTDNDDKGMSGDFMSFNIDNPATLFIGFDNRALPNIPTWMNSWNDTGDELITSDSTLRLFSKDFPAGQVMLGGNEVGFSMYVVLVAPQGSVVSGGTPTLTLTASASVIESGNSVTLTWQSSNVDTCTASNGWVGVKNASGSETIASMVNTSTFVLDCDGSNGGVSASVVVNVSSQPAIGSAMLSWTPPTTNSDGSTLVDLAGYKIKYGTSPGSHTTVIVVNNPGIADYLVEDLFPGTYYFVVTAFDNSGNESNNSNEANKTIN